MSPTVIQESPATSDAFALDNIRLRFRDEFAEKTFWKHIVARDINLIRLYSLGGIALYSAFGILDYVVAGAAVETLWFIRFGLVIPVLVSLFLFSFTHYFVQHAQQLLLGLMLTSGLGIIVMLAFMEAPTASRYYAGLVMVVIFCGSLIRLKFFFSALGGIFLCTCYWLVSGLVNPIPNSALIANSTFLLLAISISLYSSYFQEFYIRKDYITKKISDERGVALRKALAEAQRAAESRKAFAATVSHELRTPLNAIIGFSKIMKDEVLGSLGSKEYAEYVEAINEGGEHLLKVINDVINFSIDEGVSASLHETIEDIDKLITSCEAIVALTAFEKGVALEFKKGSPLPSVTLDKKRVSQILINLIANAIKFTPKGGRIVVSRRLTEEGEIAISIEDTGVGIPQDDIERVLHPFEQAKEPGKVSEGTGLGLSIAREFAGLHGGRVELESELGVGTTATLYLPSNRVATDEPLLELV